MLFCESSASSRASSGASSCSRTCIGTSFIHHQFKFQLQTAAARSRLYQKRNLASKNSTILKLYTLALLCINAILRIFLFSLYIYIFALNVLNILKHSGNVTRFFFKFRRFVISVRISPNCANWRDQSNYSTYSWKICREVEHFSLNFLKKCNSLTN